MRQTLLRLQNVTPTIVAIELRAEDLFFHDQLQAYPTSIGALRTRWSSLGDDLRQYWRNRAEEEWSKGIINDGYKDPQDVLPFDEFKKLPKSGKSITVNLGDAQATWLAKRIHDSGRIVDDETMGLFAFDIIQREYQDETTKIINIYENHVAGTSLYAGNAEHKLPHWSELDEAGRTYWTNFLKKPVG